MKAMQILALFLIFGILASGCRTTPRFPNADLSRFEALARKAIADMPVHGPHGGLLSPDHPWYEVMRQQNLRIARAPANFSVCVEKATTNGLIFMFDFADPTGLPPSREVGFLSTGKLLYCVVSSCGNSFGGGTFVTDGIPAPDAKERIPVDHRNPYDEHGVSERLFKLQREVLRLRDGTGRTNAWTATNQPALRTD